MRIQVIMAICLVVPGTILYGQCCSGGVPMSNNLGLPAGNTGTWQFSLAYDLNTLRTFKTELTQLNRQRERLTHSALLQTGFAFSNRFSIEGFVSWVRQERRNLLNNSFTFTQGVGDAVLLFKFRLTPVNNTTVLQVGVGPKIPLGSSSERNTQGITESADLQPGSGSWDGLAWLSASKTMGFRPSLTAGVTAIYRLSGENRSYLGSSVYQFGNEIQLITSLSDRINIKTIILDPSLALRYRRIGDDSFNGNGAPNTGGQFIYLVPGVKIAISNRLSYGFNIDLPLFSKPQGTQVVPSFRINTGLFYTLSPKPNAELKF